MDNKDMYERTKVVVGTLIEAKHRGTGNAIKRSVLLEYILDYVWDDMPDPDRTMRRIYAELPVITGPWGVCWPVTPEDIDKFNAYLKAKAIALFARAKKVAAEHPKLLSEKFIHQLNLYDQMGTPE